MKTVKEVYDEFVGRRKAIVRALTTDVEKFYAQCDPEKDNLCLYGYQDGSWVVDLPCEEVPPEIPEPALGINFARDGMQKRDFLALVAVHSDSWLLGLAFYKGARLNKEQREQLFQMINDLPTCYEVVSGRSKPATNGSGASAHPYAHAPGPQRPQMQHPQMQQQLAAMQHAQAHQQQQAPGNPRKRRHVADDEEDDEDDADGWQDGDGDPCPECGRLYRVDEFWIACDECEAWYCGKCAKMTEAKAQRQKTWKCNNCTEQHG